MVFIEEKSAKFREHSKTIVNKISKSKGCHKVEILQDINDRNIFFSYSHWSSEEDLNNYRNSEMFKNIWGELRKMFAKKTQAWSTEIITKSDT